MSGTKWIDIDRDNNVYTSVMNLGHFFLIRVAVYDDAEDNYISSEIIKVNRDLFNEDDLNRLSSKYQERGE